MTGNAYRERICNDNASDGSYWLIAPRDFKSCRPTGTLEDPNCSAFDSPPGIGQLKANKYNVTLQDVVQGSIATWKANGRRNGAPVPDINTQAVDRMIDHGLRAPGVFRIPICDMLEVRENWYRAFNGASLDNWPNFPCDQ